MIQDCPFNSPCIFYLCYIYYGNSAPTPILVIHSGQDPACWRKSCRFDAWVRKILWNSKWQPQRLLTFKEHHLPFPPIGLPSPKYQHQSLFILSKAAANPRILPEGLLPPDAWVQSLGTRVGFVLQISNATRRCEHALRLFLSLIFTSKPQTKGQVAKNNHWAI